MEVQEQIKPLPCPYCGRTPIIKEWNKIHNIKRLAIMCPILCDIEFGHKYWIEIEDDNVTDEDMIKLWNKKIQS